MRLVPEDAAGLFFLGRSLLADGAYTRAASALRRSLRINPNSADAKALLALSLLKGGKPSLARKTFEAALKSHPQSKKLWHGYLNALFVEAVRTYKRGDADLSRQMFAFLIDNGVDGVVPRLYLGHSFRSLGYCKEALSQYAAAQEAAPDDTSLVWYSVLACLDAGDTKGAARLLASLDSLDASQVSPQFVSLKLIKSLLDSSQWKRAAAECRAYIKAFGEDAAVHSLYGEAQRNLGNTSAALNHFFIAAQMSPDDPAPFYGLLLVYFAERNWRAIRGILPYAQERGCDEKTISLYNILCAAQLDDDAMAILPVVQNAVREFGAIPSLLLALAQTYMRAALPELAAGWFKKILDMEDIATRAEREEAMSGLFSAGTALGDKDALLEAFRMCDEKGCLPDARRLEYIKLLTEKKLWAEAAVQMEAHLRYNNGDEGARQLAKLYKNAGMYRQAAIQYRKLLRSSPRDKRLFGNLVFCLDKMGEAAVAIKLIHEANRALKPDVDLLLLEAKLCAKSGKKEDAYKALRRAAKLFPDDPRLR